MKIFNRNRFDFATFSTKFVAVWRNRFDFWVGNVARSYALNGTCSAPTSKTLFAGVEVINARGIDSIASRATLEPIRHNRFSFFGSGAVSADICSHTRFASNVKTVARAFIASEIRNGLYLLTLGAMLRGYGTIIHSKVSLLDFAQAWDTSRVLPGTLYWFFRPQYNTGWGVSQ
jgi:hypothetical protein